MPSTILWLSQTHKEDLDLVGAKAVTLGRLARAGYPVPNGFTITTQAFSHFLEGSGLKAKLKKILQKINPDNQEVVKEASTLIKKALLASPVPKDIEDDIRNAYNQLSKSRSGLVVARASIAPNYHLQKQSANNQTALLNIKGEKELLEAVKKYWSSFYNPELLAGHVQQISAKLGNEMALIIQEMVSPEVSGTIFTIDPIRNDKNTVVVEAIFGLRDHPTQSDIKPDRYEVDKKDLHVMNKLINVQKRQLIKVGKRTKEIPVSLAYNQKQKIPSEVIVEIAKISKRIENNFGFPQEIEFFISDNKPKIIKTEQVTTLQEVGKVFAKSSDINLPAIINGLPASPGIAVGLPKLISNPKNVAKVKTGDILVLDSADLKYLPAMKKAAAIIIETKDTNNYIATKSQKIGIPCVTEADKATKILKDDRLNITVNGTNGKIYKGALGPRNIKVIEYSEKKQEYQIKQIKTATKVFVSLSSAEMAKEAAKLSVDGIGFLKGEETILKFGLHPKKIVADRKQKSFISKLSEFLEVCSATFDPRPVIYRSINLKSNEYQKLKGGERYEEEEPNPSLGFRGGYRCIVEQDLFKMEIEAIKNVRNKKGLRNLWLMIPYIHNLSEMEQIKRIINSSGLHRSNSFKLLMMVEVPSNIILINEFLDLGIDGICVDINSLTTLLLGVDKDNKKLNKGFNEMDKAVLKSLEIVIGEAKKRKLYAGVCGQAPYVYPELTEKLVDWGVTSISVSPNVVEKTREIIYEAEKKLVDGK